MPDLPRTTRILPSCSPRSIRHKNGEVTVVRETPNYWRRLGLGDASRGLFEVFVQFLKQLGVSAERTNQLSLQGCGADFFAGCLEGGEVA